MNLTHAHISTPRISFLRHLDLSSEVDIHDTNFINIISEQYGGAIYHNGDSILSIKHCMFQKCQSSIESGAIYKEKGKFDCVYACFYGCFVSNEYNHAVANSIFVNSCSFLLNSSTTANCSSNPYYMQTNIKIIQSTLLLTIHNSTLCQGSGSSCFISLVESNSTIGLVHETNGSNYCCIRSIGECSSCALKISNFISNTLSYLLGDKSITCRQCSFFGNTIARQPPFINVKLQYCWGDFDSPNVFRMIGRFTQEIRTNVPHFCDNGIFPEKKERGRLNLIKVPQDVSEVLTNS